MTAATAVAWSAQTDEDLAAGYSRGQALCFDELVRRYAGPVYAFCRRMVRRPEDAEDLSQEVFVQLLRSLPAARTDTPLRPWVFVIARNKCLDHLKRRRALTFADVAPDGGEVPVADSAPQPDEVAERADLQLRLLAALSALPERYRAVVTLRYTNELSFAEIGELLGIPENTAKTQFQRAKAMLRLRLGSQE